MTLKDLGADIAAEVETILSGEFSITVTNTNTVPHSDDGAITFPNLDSKEQACKVVETCVVYIDIRRSTELNLAHRPKTVAKLYSSFVRAMVRCAEQFNGHVRGIIGDRVMIMFDQNNCFSNAVHTAAAMNTVSQHIINRHFKHGEVACGIGIDFGRMLATKTGFRRHGVQRHSYRSLVWLGRPANVASKLTDIANKAAVTQWETKARVAYDYGFSTGWHWSDESLEQFVSKLEAQYAPSRVVHTSPYYGSFFTSPELITLRPATPPILMTKTVYDGYCGVYPNANIVRQGTLKQYAVQVPGYDGQIYGGNLVYEDMKQ
ncbi:Guanylate cyclase domain-containing protein [Paraburkholderia tropica]|uniref:adenylate/guanylate cyclase domain-containing protein n=1 Tax=Paraburkholderia tropica TaxID=92647 RepID=UPI001CB185F4|nr:adenylate/guanylate cyclase domain-containing protein [Paraburkholderia tropica]CAG9228376.1 Guanylate cyclase domain-containing protein [Paraburkholderia tropica]